MKILANRKIKRLFCRVLFSFAAGILAAAAGAGLDPENAVWYLLFSFAGVGAAVLCVMYLYFRDQSRIMERSISQIRAYIAGDPDARIECDEEGDLYRLFQEVNSLAAILNAHAENEGRAKKFMKDTISDISHQLKTPLAALNIYNGITQEEAEDAAAVREFSALSEQELDRIETLVQNLLKIAGLDAGTIVFEKSEENLSDMMEQIGKQFAYRAEREGKKLSLSGDDSVFLFCDRTWLAEAVSNIVKNAFDHTEKGDTIRIEWRKFAFVVQIVVSDSGSGIHPEDLPHIFKRFYRSRFSKDTQGIGLGLPLAKAIVEAHSGTIQADSELKAGTVFTIDFLVS